MSQGDIRTLGEGLYEVGCLTVQPVWAQEALTGGSLKLKWQEFKGHEILGCS